VVEDPEDMALALGQLIQQQDAVVRQRHFAWQRHQGAADQAHVGDRVVRRSEGAHIIDLTQLVALATRVESAKA